MKRKIFVGLLIVLVASIGYGIVWQWAAREFKQKIVFLLNDLKNHQCDVQYTRLKIKGFPFKLMAELENPVFTKDKVGLAIIKVEGNIYAQSSLFNFKKLSFSTHGSTHITYKLDSSRPIMLLTTQQLEGDMDLSRHGLNRAASIILGQVDMVLKETKIKAEKIVLNNFQTQIPTHLSVQMSASNVMTDLKLQVPFDQKIEQLNLKAHFDLEDPIEIKSLSGLLEALARQGGVFELEDLNLQWGKLKVQANGTWSLDTEKQPLASMSVTVQGLEDILTQLAQLKLIKSYVPGIAGIVLSPFKVVKTDPHEQPIYKIPLTLQEGDLSIASFSLLKIPKINWELPAYLIKLSEVK